MRALARDRLIESRLTPNAISITGLVGNLVAAVLILEHHFVLAGVAFILGSLCDMFDGRYSRMSGKGTPFGAFLDSTLDRVEEGVVLAAVAVWFAQDGNDVAVGATVIAVVGSYMVSYTRARAEALGVGVQGRDSFSRGAGSNPLGGTGVRRGRACARLGPARAGDLRDGRAHRVHRASEGAPRPSAARRRSGHRVTQTELGGCFPLDD